MAVITDAWQFWALLGPAVIVAAGLIASLLIVLLRPLLLRHAMARPNARSSHKTPTPQGGGIAVVAATLAVTVAVALAFRELAAGFAISLWTMLAAALLVSVVGLADDIRSLSVGPRLLLQTLAVAAVIAALPADLRVVPALPLIVERALLLLGGLWFLNLVNFMDGLDWMTVAEVVPLSAGLALLGLLGALPSVGIVVAFALLGAMLGFAPFNRPVAMIFLGDVGSLPIGLVLGWLLVLLAGNGHFAAALLLPAYYLADATITLCRRLADRERVWQSHRSHFYQRATDRGFSVEQIVGRVFAVNVALVLLAVVTVRFPSAATSLGALAAGGALVAWLLSRFARGKP